MNWLFVLLFKPLILFAAFLAIAFIRVAFLKWFPECWLKRVLLSPVGKSRRYRATP